MAGVSPQRRRHGRERRCCRSAICGGGRRQRFDAPLARFMAQHLAPGFEARRGDVHREAAACCFRLRRHASRRAEHVLSAPLIVLEGTLNRDCARYSVNRPARSVSRSQWVRAQILARRDAAGGARRDHAYRPDAAPAPAPHRPARSRRSNAKGCACASATSTTKQDTASSLGS